MSRWAQSMPKSFSCQKIFRWFPTKTMTCAICAGKSRRYGSKRMQKFQLYEAEWLKKLLPQSEGLMLMLRVLSFWLLLFAVLSMTGCASFSPKPVTITKTVYLTVPLDMVKTIQKPEWTPAPGEGRGEDIFPLLEECSAAIDAHNIEQEGVREAIKGIHALSAKGAH